MDRERRVLEQGGVYVENDTIIEVGPIPKLRRERNPDLELVFEDGIVMPGLVCAHTHLYGILLRGARLHLPPPTDFTQNLQRIWWPLDEALTLEDAYASALSASLEMALNGVTLFADTYSGPNSINGVLDEIERAVRSVGIRGVVSFESTERHSSEEGYKGVEENIRFIKKKAGERDPLVTGMMSIHASFTVTDELMRYAVEKARELRAPITIHVLEGLGDLYHNLERYGKRTIERLKDVGLLGRDAVLAHVVHVTDDELRLIKESGAHVAHNPMSNMLNAVGTAPVPRMLRMGVNVGLGNDGYIFDHFENMRASFLVHKLETRDPRVLTPVEVVEMATINAARAYGLDGTVGSLEPGKKADLIVVRPRLMPTPLNKETVYGHLVNTVDGDDVDTVIVNGEVVVRGGRPTKVSLEEVNKVSQESAEKLWARFSTKSEQVDVVRL